MMMLSSATLNAGNHFFPNQMYLAYSYGEQVEDEPSRFQQQTIAVAKSPSFELVDLVVENVSRIFSSFQAETIFSQ